MKDPIVLLKSRISASGVRGAAREIGCSAPYLLDIINGRRGCGPKVLKALGIERTVKRVVTYRPRISA
jgi:hypothetical protein